MPNPSIPVRERPRWEVVADQLQKDAAEPTSEQVRVADAIGVALPVNIPAPVAAIVLRKHLADVLFASIGAAGEIPDVLTELEGELGIATHAHLVTGTREEVSAWFAARYMVKTACGLRDVQPQPGDIVTSHGWPDEKRVIEYRRRWPRLHEGPAIPEGVAELPESGRMS